MSKRLRDESVGPQDLSLAEDADIHTPKYIDVDESAPEERKTGLFCSLPPHKLIAFASYPEYESHYHASHTNCCRDCKRNFPSNHFLDLHLAENHDPIVATKRDHGEKTYCCFVEGCDKICADWKKRRSHLVDKHGFPKNYDFFIVNAGIDGRRSMLRPGVDAQGHRKSSRERRGSGTIDWTQTTDATPMISATDSGVKHNKKSATPASFRAKAVQDMSSNEAIDAVTTSMSSLQFVPRSVSFGKRKGRSGFTKG